MSGAVAVPWLEAQADDVRGQMPDERDALVVSARMIGRHWLVLSRYGDGRWRFAGQPTNKQPCQLFIDFSVIPAPLCLSMKAIVYRYLRRGREGKKLPSHRSVIKLLSDARPFLQHLDRLGIDRLADVTPMVCALYIEACMRSTQLAGCLGRSLSVLQPYVLSTASPACTLFDEHAPSSTHVA